MSVQFIEEWYDVEIQFKTGQIIHVKCDGEPSLSDAVIRFKLPTDCDEVMYRESHTDVIEYITVKYVLTNPSQ